MLFPKGDNFSYTGSGPEGGFMKNETDSKTLFKAIIYCCNISFFKTHTVCFYFLKFFRLVVHKYNFVGPSISD